MEALVSVLVGHLQQSLETKVPRMPCLIFLVLCMVVEVSMIYL